RRAGPTSRLLKKAHLLQFSSRLASARAAAQLEVLPPSPARSTYREYASRAGSGRRLASGPFEQPASFSASCWEEEDGLMRVWSIGLVASWLAVAAVGALAVEKHSGVVTEVGDTQITIA